jgi:hypothetical protein
LFINLAQTWVMEPEKRTLLPRQKALKAGKAILSASTLVDCLIRNTSDGGARLQFHALVILPAEFKLQIGASGDTRPVTLAWQRGLTAGVKFAH